MRLSVPVCESVGPDEVLLEVKAVGLNFRDVLNVLGKQYLYTSLLFIIKFALPDVMIYSLCITNQAASTITMCCIAVSMKG